MLAELSRLIAMSGATAKPAIRKAVHELALSGKCLISGCECESETRGLCPKHYMAFLREQQSRPKNEQADFEAAAIREGKVLATGEIREIKSTNPFADL